MSHKLLEDDIKGWKHNTFDQVIVKKKKIMARSDGIHNCYQRNENYTGLKKLEKNLEAKLSIILKKGRVIMVSEISNAMRVRWWLSDGDRNTRYYHMKTINRRRKNKILMLKNDQGQWIEEEKQLQEL